MGASNHHKNLQSSKKKSRIFMGTLAGLILAGMIAFFVYFHVEHVEVMSSDRYSEEEIKEMVLRGPLATNSVLAPLLYSREVNDVHFVEGFEVKQVNRDTIAISVREKQPVGCIPFLDCYMYFDRSGQIVESAIERDLKIPFFEGLAVERVALGEELDIKEESVLNTAVSLARIFEKNDLIPDHIHFDEKYQITLEYGEIQVKLGPDSFLEDKMSRLIAILPKISGQKGILHMENVDATVKTITFEKEEEKAGDDLQERYKAFGNGYGGNEKNDEKESDEEEISQEEIYNGVTDKKVTGQEEIEKGVGAGEASETGNEENSQEDDENN